MKIIAIGRNYMDHIKELGNDVTSDPMVFMKPDTALLKNNEAFYYPAFSKEIHHELELVVRICKEGKNISKKFASKYYDKYGIGVDFTARDLQRKCKEEGLPWEIAKAFNNSAAVSELLSSVGVDLLNLDLELKINGHTKQLGNTNQMMHSIDDLIVYISQFFTLRSGDLLYTGTPKGVGEVQVGDRLEGFLNNKKMLDFEIK